MIAALAAWALALNALAFGAFWRDKRRARRGGPRIRERTLLTQAVLVVAGCAFYVFAF